MYYKQFKYSSYIAYEMSTKLLKKYLNSNLKFHTENETSKLLRNVKDEIGQFGIGGVQQLIILMNEAVIFIAILILLGIYETKFLIISFSCFSTVGLLYYISLRKLFGTYGEKRQFYATKVTKFSLETLYGIKSIKLFNVGSNFLNKFKSNAKKYADTIKITTTLNQVPRIGLEFLTVLIVCVVLIYIFNPNSLDKEFLPSAGLFIIAAFKLIPSISKILNSLNILNYTYPSVLVLKKEFNSNDTLDDDLDLVKTNFYFKKNIEFKNVSFDFKDRNKNLLSSINLEIKKNTTIGLMGDSGSGKSTLIDLLTGMYQPKEGKILVDGQDINNIRKGWRDIICIVPQKIFTTNDTIKNNIAFGLNEQEIDNKMIEKAVKFSQLEEFINKLPAGINTLIGDKGMEISGGELQRIGIARALYRNSEIIILDEFTSSLDKSNEETIMKLIKSFKGKKTLIIIAHKKELIDFCDYKFKIVSSKLVKLI